MTRKPALALLAAATTLLASCAAPRSDGAASAPRPAVSGGWLGEEADLSWDESAGGTPDRSTGAFAMTDAMASEAAPAAPTPPGGADIAVPDQRPGPGLQAGSVDDNAAFADYLKYRDEFQRLGLNVSDFDVTERHVITVVDKQGKPVLGARVRSGSQEARTGADGRALLFGAVAGATVRYGNETAEADFDGTSRQHRVTLPLTRTETGRAKLDVLFLIDTTGSMGDEIDRLKESVRSVAARIAGLPSKPDLHLGMTVYRDRGDLFVTRTFDFTDSVATFNAGLVAVQAGGGGDTPEDLNAGLHEAVTKPSWRGDDTVKLVFLIADAPPHLDYEDGPNYLDDVRTAAAEGIKLMPIASSGLDDQGEYIFRQLAQLTLGRFTFLTYGADGASPGTGTDHHVSDYAVLALDDLVVRLVTDELASLSPSGQ